MELKKKIVTLVSIFAILTTTFIMLPTIGNPGLAGPGVDEYYAVFVPSPDAQLAKLRADEVQSCDVPYFEEIQKLRDEGYFVQGPFMSMYFDYYDINVGGYKHYPAHGFPLNSTHFRRAIAYLTNTEELIATSPLIKGFVIRNHAWPGRLAGAFYNDRESPDPLACDKFIYNPENAIHEMFLGEFVPISKSTGNPMTEVEAKANPGDIDHWEYDPAGTPIGPTGPIRTIEVYGCTSWPFYIDMANAWVGGMEGVGIPTTPFYALMATIWPKVSKGDFDVGVFGTAWGAPDPFIMNFYFPSWNQPNITTGAPCCNWRFWEDPEVDEWITTWGTTLNETLAIEAAHKVQQKVANEAIMPAAWTWTAYTGHHPALMGVQRSAYRTDAGLTYLQTQWWDPAEKVAHNNIRKTAWYEEPVDLHPNIQVDVASSVLLGAIVDGYGAGFGLTVTDPCPWSPTYLSPTQAKPWLAYDYKLEPWGDGTKTTYYLRKDIYWHDGVQFSADDVKFCLEYLRDHGHVRGQSAYTTEYLDHVDVLDVGTSSTDATPDGWNEAVVYHTQANLFTFSYTSYWAAEIPKHIWEGVADPDSVKPWELDNPVVGAPLTWLVGTGPLVYHKGDWEAGVYIRLRANRNYFRDGEVSVADINFDYRVNVLDAIPVTINFGVTQADPEYLNHYDINCNGEVDIYDVGLLLAHFGKTW